jgi:hypothetical protein
MPRFVILEHRWRGVHWDLMLEITTGAGLRTWALEFDPLGEPTPWPIPARALADHRVAYLTYEGPVSGDRGAVRRVEAGIYETIRWTDSVVEVDLAGERLRGRLELSASGVPGQWLARLQRAKVD